MKSRIALVLAPAVCLVALPAWAQTATGVGVGTGVANSRSQSGAVAISGQGGSVRGSGNSSSALTLNSNVPAATSANVNSSVTERNVPSTFAPGLTAAGLETCLGSVSGGGSVVGTGVSFGTTVPDPGCAARLDARTLWSMGLKKAAVARLCLTPEIYRSMPDVCGTYLPVQQPQPVGLVMTASTSGPSGPIEVIEGKTGTVRLCDNYDAARQRCRAWTGEKMKVAQVHPRQMPKAVPASGEAKPATPVAPPAPVAPPVNTDK